MRNFFVAFFFGTGVLFGVSCAPQSVRIREEAPPSRVFSADALQRVEDGLVVKFFEAVRSGDCETVRLLASQDPRVLELQDPEKGLAQGETALMLAAERGHAQMVRALLACGAKVEARDAKGWSALHYAVSSGSQEVFKALTEKAGRAGLSESDPPLLNLACLIGSADIAELCLSLGADLEGADAEGYTPLLCALEKGHVQLASLLLARGANSQAHTPGGVTALHLAAASGASELVREFLSRGLDADAKEAETGQTPLGEAALNGRPEVVRLLLEKGAKITSGTCSSPLFLASVGPKGRLALYTALNKRQAPFQPGTEADYLAVAALLVSHGADLNAKDEHGFSPLTNALGYGFHRMADYLLEKGARLSLERCSAGTLLHFACAGGNRKIAEELLSMGAAVEERGLNGFTPLHYAADNGRPAVAELLLAHHADAEAQTQDGRTALHLAAQGGAGHARGQSADEDYAATAKVLIQSGAKVEKAWKATGAQPLHVAAVAGNVAVARVLLDHQAPVEGLDSAGCTPLLVAAMSGQADFARFLLGKGANRKARSSDGATALHCAALSGSEEAVKVFLGQGIAVDDAGLSCDKTPLCMAALHGHVKLVRLLLASGAKPEPDVGTSPLMWALVGNRTLTCQRGLSAQGMPFIRKGTPDDYLCAAKVLIGAGANVNARTKDRDTTLDLALDSGCLAAADLLIECGADVDGRLLFGRTVLHKACADGDSKTTEYVLSKGANVEALDDGGFTPLLSAADLGRPALIALLVKHHAKVRAVAKDGRTALHLVAQGRLKNTPLPPEVDSDYAGAAQELIRHGADVRAASERTGMQPLHTAAWAGNKPVARVLLDSGAAVDAVDNEGNTPLAYAVKYSNSSVAELLLVCHADACHKNGEGLSPLDLAQRQSDSEMEALLKKIGPEGTRGKSQVENKSQMTSASEANPVSRDVDPLAAAEQALRVAERNLRADHPELAVCLCQLGDAYCTNEQYALAAMMYRRALSIQEKTLGSDHAEVAEVLEKLAAVYRKIGSWEKEADDMEKRAAAIRSLKR